VENVAIGPLLRQHHANSPATETSTLLSGEKPRLQPSKISSRAIDHRKYYEKCRFDSSCAKASHASVMKQRAVERLVKFFGLVR
jgi:hypothetical protein